MTSPRCFTDGGSAWSPRLAGSVSVVGLTGWPAAASLASLVDVNVVVGNKAKRSLPLLKVGSPVKPSD